MFDLPPQVYEVTAHTTEYVNPAKNDQIPFKGSVSSTLEINNQTGYNVYVTIPVLYYPGCWVGGASPTNNFNGVAIKRSNYLSRTEEFACSGWSYNSFIMNFKFAADNGDEQIAMHVDQYDIFRGSFTNQSYTIYKAGSRDFTGNYKVTQTVDYPSGTNSFQITSRQ